MSRVCASCCCCQVAGGAHPCSGIPLRSSSARRRASALASGDIIARSSLSFVVFGIVFPLRPGNVVVVSLVCQRHVLFVPPIDARLVAASRQERHAARIENADPPVRVALVLHAELTHRGVTRSVYFAAVRKREMWAALFQHWRRLAGPNRRRLGIVKERGGSQQNILRRVRRALFGGLGYSLPALE